MAKRMRRASEWILELMSGIVLIVFHSSLLTLFGKHINGRVRFNGTAVSHDVWFSATPPVRDVEVDDSPCGVHEEAQ